MTVILPIGLLVGGQTNQGSDESAWCLAGFAQRLLLGKVEHLSYHWLLA